jgi:hypothetical protein
MAVIVLNRSTRWDGSGHDIDTTSRSDNFGVQLSPFLLGPVDLYQGYTAKNVENAWQYSKVYREHLTPLRGTSKVSDKYFKWARDGWKKDKAVRYPMGRGRKPEFSYWNGKRLSYVEARKNIYIPLYARAVRATDAFKRLLKWHLNGETVILRDFDSYNYEDYGMDLEDVLNASDKIMGHSFVLAMMLKKHVQVYRDKTCKVFGYLIPPNKNIF